MLLVEPAAFLRCRSSATGRGYEYRFALFSLQMSFVQGESILQAVPQIADIILTYHNSNLLVIARRFVASSLGSRILFFEMCEICASQAISIFSCRYCIVPILVGFYVLHVGSTLMATIVYTRGSWRGLLLQAPNLSLRPTVLLKNFLSFPDTGLISGQTMSYQGLPRANHLHNFSDLPHATPPSVCSLQLGVVKVFWLTENRANTLYFVHKSSSLRHEVFLERLVAFCTRVFSLTTPPSINEQRTLVADGECFQPFCRTNDP